MDPFVLLAKTAVEKYIKEGITIDPPDKLSAKIKNKAGVFVSIYKNDKVLRGCIGTLKLTSGNIFSEIVRNAIAASVGDPRFPQVVKEELPDLSYSVDILSKPKRVSSVKNVDIKKYGLIVSGKGNKRGVLLPGIPGIDTPEKQLEICKLKAGITNTEKVKLQLFTAKRHQ